MITGLFVWGGFDFSLSLLTSYRFVQIFCFFFSYFCSLCAHRNVCFIQVVFCAGLSLFIITVVVGLVLGFCYLTKLGSPPPLGVKPTYWNWIVVKENAVFIVKYHTRSPGHLILKAPKLPSGLQGPFLKPKWGKRIKVMWPTHAQFSGWWWNNRAIVVSVLKLLQAWGLCAHGHQEVSFFHLVEVLASVKLKQETKILFPEPKTEFHKLTVIQAKFMLKCWGSL